MGNARYLDKVCVNKKEEPGSNTVNNVMIVIQDTPLSIDLFLLIFNSPH